MSDNRRFPEHSRDDAEALYAAAIVGDEEFAHQLVRLGLSNEEDSLEYARRLRPEYLAMSERAMAGEDPSAAIRWRLAERVRLSAGFPARMPSVQEVAVALANAINDDPLTMSMNPDRDRSPEDMMDLAQEMHRAWLVQWEEYHEDD